MEDQAWDHSTYTRNRDRLIAHDVVRALFGQVMQQAKDAALLSAEHFTVDGTMIRAWASHKSFVPKDGPPLPSSGSRSNPDTDFKGQRRSNETHSSKTDPDSRLYTKSKKQESVPAFLGHVVDLSPGAVTAGWDPEDAIAYEDSRLRSARPCRLSAGR